MLPYGLSWLLGFAAAGYLLYRRYPWLHYDFIMIKKFVASLIQYAKWEKKNIQFPDLLEQNAAVRPDKTFVIFQGNNYSYRYINNKANQVAHTGLKLGLKTGDVVAILIHNEPAFIWTFLGLAKIGVKVAFLNFNLRQKSLAYCFNVSKAKLLIIGQSDELVGAVQEIYKDLEPQNLPVYVQGTSQYPKEFQSFDNLMNGASLDQVSREYRSGLTVKEPLCYIYTSGTTGLPKAAIMSHMKSLKATFLTGLLGMQEDDIIYTVLPLYHSAAGMIGLGGCLATGATMVLRSKFSASHFWEECCQYNVTVIQYIGELLRYLVATPKSKYDRMHNVQFAVGNGLRKDVWAEFVERFRVPVIGEFYAATEGNSGFINLFNKFGSVGRCSPFLGPITPSYFIKYDYDSAQPLRNDKGFCTVVKPGEPGLMVTPIKKRLEFDGYCGKKTLSESKVVQNVFKKGDQYFNTGDLMVYDEEYFVYFHDRIGDTFRWKGENVSTTEVANIVADVKWIEDANVYGVEVPGHDGKAGMAAVTLAEGGEATKENLSALYHHCENLLPSYARPRFLRFQPEMAMTNTYKQTKFHLVKEGFNPATVSQAMYYMDVQNKTFSPLTQEAYEKVIEGKIRV